jgi:glycosyltransferase involved in cell wall biosynthesis
MFPGADLFSPIVDHQKLHHTIRNRAITTSFLQKIPFAKRWHRHLLPLYPLALEQFDLSGYDLVLSSESGPAKGVITGSATCHVCYCHSPMRYLWDFYHDYRNGHSVGGLSRPIFTLAAPVLRIWDSACANRVDHFVANSTTVARRIRKHYRREATVIHPPIKTATGFLADQIDDYYLTAGQLVDYKRIDLAIEACNRLGRRLHVVGEGEQYRALRKLAGPTIVFCGALCDSDLYQQYAHCRALLFPGEEDCGMVPVEAMSCGRPVIAYARGGATETVIGLAPSCRIPASAASGVLFEEHTADSLAAAILAFERCEADFVPLEIKKSTERFDESHFRVKLAGFLIEKLAHFRGSLPL